MTQDRLDQLIENTCKNHVETLTIVKDIPVPQFEEAWQTFRDRLEKEQTRPSIRQRFAVRAAVLAVCILVGSFLFSILLETPGAQAVRFQLYKSFMEYGEDFFSIRRTNKEETGLTEPADSMAPKDEENVVNRQLTLEELQKKAPFHVLLPDRLPIGYTLDRIDWRNYAAGIHNLRLIYLNAENDELILQQELDPYEIEEMMTGETQNQGVALVEVKGRDILLIGMDNGYYNASWYQDGIRISIHSSLGREEILTLIDGMR